VVWAGTGSEGIRSNVSAGRGIYRSADGGKTWSFAGLRDVGQIGGVRIHPRDPNTVFVAATGNVFARNRERGVFRTRDGGQSWKKVLFVSDSTGAVDVEFQPGNPDVLYASMWRGERKPWTVISGAREGGIYRSTDGGDTWTKLGGGLPTGLFGKSNVAVTAANPRRVYALVEAKPGGGLYRSEDAGDTWTQVSDYAQLITRPFYYTNITADPTNPTWCSWAPRASTGPRTAADLEDPAHPARRQPRPVDQPARPAGVGAGKRRRRQRHPQRRTHLVHPVQPAHRRDLSGLRRQPVPLPGLRRAAGQLHPDRPLAAAVAVVPDDPVQSWRSGPGCETGPIIPHPTQPDTVYGSCKGQYSRMSLRTGQEKQYWVGAQSLYGNPGKDLILRFQRVSPMEISPHDPRVIYYGSQHVHRTTDEGVTWERISPDLTANDPRYQQRPSGEPITLDVTGEEYYSTLYAIRESRLEPGVIWAGANDGPIHVTRDGGRTWTRVTPRGLPSGGRVQTIEPSPHRKGSAYVAVLRYLLGDFQPYIYRTDDYGRTWTRLTDGRNGVPADHPTRVVREDPDREGLLYAGTEFGMFVSFDNGRAWRPFQLNLPVTPVTDLQVHRGDLVVSTQGRSFWILDDLTPLHQLGERLPAEAHLFRPREAYRMRYASGFGGVESARSGPDQPQYPPAGAMIDYFLADTTGVVTLEVVDAAGAVVRGFSSEAAGERLREPEQPGMRAPTLERVGTPRLPRQQGLNRFVWDLSLPGAWDANPQRSGRGGPMALPGRYTLRLVAGGRTHEQPLEVRMDPRVAADGVTEAELREQLAHNLRVRDLVSDANRLVARVRQERERLAAAGAASAGQLRRVQALEARLVAEPVRYGRPGLQTHIGYLYGLSVQADQELGRDAVERYAVLRRELDERGAELEAILAGR
jgi:photosystem II stability/assembly factor-like uncharacterized protein